MASIFNRQNKKSFNLMSDIVFEGALLSDTRAVLVTELINYILYEREQIPLPVEQLKLRTHTTQKDNLNGPNMIQKKNPAQNMVDRKAKLFLTDLSQMCENLKNSFRSCPEIDQVAILLGGTVVSPRESYIIKLPPPCPDADNLSLGSSKNTLFKKIIGEDTLGSLKSLSPSNVFVLLSAPRSHPLTWFLPKHCASPQTGSIVSFNFRCVYLVPICYDLSITECDSSNLSGLEPLECTICTTAEENQSSDTNGYDGSNSEEEDTDSCCERESGVSLKSKQLCDTKVAAAERFCEHKRLNYVFSGCKQGRKHVVNSPETICLTVTDGMKSPEILVDDSMDLCFTPGNSNLIYRDLIDSISDEERTLRDYIWYQSPVMLKGFKDHIPNEH